jgi:hypothetical protein
VTATQSGYLLIADITGYTAFLSASELDHAQGTLTSLLELLIEHTRPPLVISRLAGDAVISYGLQDQFMQGQTFVELIEDTYVAFRKAIERMVLNNTCRCQACANVGSLDLKFFVHHGEFGLQRLSQHDELVGSDVILIHRLLKNHVAETLGIRAYTLYTDAAIRRLGLQDMCVSLAPHAEVYEHLGEVQTWIQPMHPVWEAKRASARVTIPPDRIAVQVEAEIAMPPHVLWDYLANPDFRKFLVGSDSQRILNRSQGRVAPGSAFQCFHGKSIITQTVLEWQPFELMTTEDLVMPDLSALLELRLQPTQNGSRLILTFGKPRGAPLKRLVGALVLGWKARSGSGQRDLDTFKARVEADYARRGAAPQAVAIGSGEIAQAASASLAAHD